MENGGAVKLSAGHVAFPQVFHRALWMENRLFYKSLGRFYTFTQALFLLLSLNYDLHLISIRKWRAADVSTESGSDWGFDIV